MTRRPSLALLLLCLAVPGTAQQRPDDSYQPRLSRPAYDAAGPVVAIDGAHRNFHTLQGGYGPFARLASADGYRVRSNDIGFTAAALRGVDVLVIVNARIPAPSASAFSAEEIAALKRWVEEGGSLLLIADHAPFGVQAAPLAQAFGVPMGLGYVVANDSGRPSSQIPFTGDRLAPHPILTGRDGKEKVRKVVSFTGQSLGVPAGATALLTLPRDALEVESPAGVQALARGGRVPARDAGGRAQGVAMTVGKGRLVVLGEAAMLTAQVMPMGRVGVGTADNQQFALNILHWLSRVTG